MAESLLLAQAEEADRLARWAETVVVPYLRGRASGQDADAQAARGCLLGLERHLGRLGYALAAPVAPLIPAPPLPAPVAGLCQITRAQMDRLADDAPYFVRLIRCWQPVPVLIWEGVMPLKIARATPAAREKARLPPWLGLSVLVAYGEWAEYTGMDIQESGDLALEDWVLRIYADWGAGAALESVTAKGEDVRLDPVLAAREVLRLNLPPVALRAGM